ncbi:MAG: prolyl-tRNA synthetase associated domain-containing protein [Rhodospirillales bacterium]|nr:prolyl-tRNA synthetase associated domain-containing protein [Rhodospirillales bacterium]
MAATEHDLMARLAELGIDHTTYRHSAVFTVGESRAHCGHIPGCHCKNLFLKDKKGVLWLVVARDDAPISMKQLDRQIGSARLSFGKAELLGEVLGVIPGAVTPFALINDTEQQVNVILDQTMMGAEIVNYHPLTNEATTSLAPDALLAFIRSCGHEPQIMNVDASDDG